MSKNPNITPSRRLKYATVQDIDQCQREVVRMLSIIRHLVYESGTLLNEFILGSKGANKNAEADREEATTQQKSFVSMNAATKSM